MNTRLVEDIAKAVLYEGYLLYPYRASAVKNRQRWNFGVLSPLATGRPRDRTDSCRMQIECLARGRSLGVRLRFLQLMQRDTVDATGAVVDSWQEAIEREVGLEAPSIESLVEDPHRELFTFPSGATTGPEFVIRRLESVHGIVQIDAEQEVGGWFRLRLTIENSGCFHGAGRDQALLQSLVSTHAILSLGDGEFASLLDPPEDLRDAAAACRNVGAYPVLAGEAGSRDAMLCSPIILYDYPQIAPESAGALFDGTEIDEILSLRILTMTPEEKAEMRAVDDFARRILERTESLAPEQFMKMHGTLRRPDPEGSEAL